MNKVICSLLCAIAASFSARAAVTAEVHSVIIQYATQTELDETVLPTGLLVYNADAACDVRVGDGVSVGGNPIWNTDALTNPPSSFPYEIAMNEHAVNLSHSYSIGADAGTFYIRANGDNVFAIHSALAGVGDVVKREMDAEGETFYITLSVPEDTPEPLVEYTASIIDVDWTNCTYTVSNLTDNLMLLAIDTDPDAAEGYYKITALSDFSICCSLPLEVPLLEVGGTRITNNLITLNDASTQVGLTRKAAAEADYSLYRVDNAGTEHMIYDEQNFASGNYLTVPAAQASYWRITTPPATSTAFGLSGQMAYSNNFVYVYNSTSSCWIRCEGSMQW